MAGAAEKALEPNSDFRMGRRRPDEPRGEDADCGPAGARSQRFVETREMRS